MDCKKKFESRGKTSKFLLYPQDVCLFSVFFYLNEEELFQQACLIKYVKNEKFPTALLAKQNKKQKRGAKT